MTGRRRKATSTTPPPCLARQPVSHFDGTTYGITKSSLPCALTRGHGGHHVCETPEGPYMFPNADDTTFDVSACPRCGTVRARHRTVRVYLLGEGLTERIITECAGCHDPRRDLMPPPPDFAP